MSLQTPDNNPILRYWAEIESGDIVVNKKIQVVYKHLAARVRRETEFHYDAARGNHALVFFERFLRHVKGPLGGKLIRLELWQRALLAATFGFVDIEDMRQYQQVVLLMGKKNGKSLLASGVGLYGLTADGEAGAEIYSVATTREQAKIVWSVARSMRNKSPQLRKRVRSTVAGLFYDTYDSVFKPLASNYDNLDGLNVHMALMDEMHQWRNGRALFDIIADGISAREQPLLMLTSTAGTVRDDIYDEKYDECKRVIDGLEDPDGYKDERLLPIIYELDDRSEWTDPDMWIKANPNLGVSKKRSYLEEKVKRTKASKNKASERDLLTKEFNIPESAATSFFSYDDINNRDRFDWGEGGKFTLTSADGVVTPVKAPKYAIGGFDLSVRGDLTAAVAAFHLPDNDVLYVDSMFWMPETVLEDHIVSDKVPYDLYRDQGHLRICPGNQVDYKMVRAWFLELRDKYSLYLPYIGYDPAYAAYLVDDLKGDFGQNALQAVRQGYITLGMPMGTIEKLFKAGKVNYRNNPLMRYNLLSVSVEEDRNGNLMPSKRQRNYQRIDGFSAMLNAWTTLQQNYEQYMALI